MSAHLAELNAAQKKAVTHGHGPLLIIAGPGSGKTKTLAHRVAQLVVEGADPRRILLLTFSRRAADEMARRARSIVEQLQRQPAHLDWAGTFHGIANRLLRLHSRSIGLDPAFTVLDRSDAADMLDVLRQALGLDKSEKRFPQKATCLAIYSRAVNAREPIEVALKKQFPWCASFAEPLRLLFGRYVETKQQQSVLDYDDLLLYWAHLMSHATCAAEVGARFDHVLVDEYQDTNLLQADILRGLKPSGAGVTVVGDDAQSIYSFRAAEVRNIIDFPAQFSPPAEVITLEQNYRSTQTILDAANAVIANAKERFTKNLFSERPSRDKPVLIVAEDEAMQVDYVVTTILAQREAGIPLKEQAVLFRAAHHSDALEVELSRRQIPFVKFGGLKFLEAAHVKDVLSVLRWAENPRDQIAGFRTLQLLPGVGPSVARHAADFVGQSDHDLAALAQFMPPKAARQDWPHFCALLNQLRAAKIWTGQLGAVRRWYEPHLHRLHDDAQVRNGDLEQLETIAAGFSSREQFLSELTLDPPQASGDNATTPHLDEDYLILSTIHSAKGQEWHSVFVLNVADGCIPSDLSAGEVAQLEEERRLLYVAMTRARDSLHLVHPHRFFVRQQKKYGERYVTAPRSRFIPDNLLGYFEQRSWTHTRPDGSKAPVSDAQIDVAAKLRAMWA